jgi:D-glycero-alpha-D-manno-heptose 1-phosphate guanylyltransferase
LRRTLMDSPSTTTSTLPSTTCIILAGGLGTRLRAAVPDKPKCLAPIGRRSFLEVQLDMLARQGVRRFVLSLGHMADMVRDEAARLGSRFEISTVTETQPLGTGGAMWWTMSQLGLTEAVVTNGDTFLGGSLAGMMTPLAHAQGELARMAVLNVPDRARFGGVALEGAQVRGFLEKGAQGPGLINAGFYRVHRDCFARFAPGQVFSFETDVLATLARQGSLRASVTDGAFTDIGVPDDYHRFCHEYA